MTDFFERLEKKKRSEAKQKEIDDALRHELEVFRKANPNATVQQWRSEIRRILKKVYRVITFSDPDFKTKLNDLAKNAADGQILIAALPYARDGIAWRKRMKETRDRKDDPKTRAEKIKQVQDWLDRTRKNAPDVTFTKTWMIRKASQENAVPLSTLNDWVRKGRIKLPIDTAK